MQTRVSFGKLLISSDRAGTQICGKDQAARQKLPGEAGKKGLAPSHQVKSTSIVQATLMSCLGSALPLQLAMQGLLSPPAGPHTEQEPQAGLRAKRGHGRGDDAKSKAEQSVKPRTPGKCPQAGRWRAGQREPRAVPHGGDPASQRIHAISNCEREGRMPLQTYFRFLYVFLCSSAPRMSRTSAHSFWEHSKCTDFSTSPFQGAVSLATVLRSQGMHEAGLASVDTRPLVSVTLARDHIQGIKTAEGDSVHNGPRGANLGSFVHW